MESLHFETMPSTPILQACAKTVGPSPSMCSLNRMPGLIRALPDLCSGIESGRPVSSHPFEPSAATALVGWSPALHRMLFFKGR
jgi:hypothetical protein